MSFPGTPQNAWHLWTITKYTYYKLNTNLPVRNLMAPSYNSSREIRAIRPENTVTKNTLSQLPELSDIFCAQNGHNIYSHNLLLQSTWSTAVTWPKLSKNLYKTVPKDDPVKMICRKLYQKRTLYTCMHASEIISSPLPRKFKLTTCHIQEKHRH